MSLPGVEDARARMLARVARLPAETVGLDAALGRVLRGDVLARRDQPPFAAAVMDGWAVREADMGENLRMVGESAAGRGWDGTLGPMEAVRISTGAPLPRGADRVVMQEEAARDGDRVRVTPSAGSGRFVRAQGADFARGARLLEAGVVLDPWRLALAAAAGEAALSVGVRPRVAVAPTGDEVAVPGAAPGPWQVFDAAGAGVVAWFGARGCRATRCDALPDDRAAVAAALADTACDLLVTIGGASVGDHDIVKPALRDLGLDMVVEGVAVRPGKPVWFGVLPDGRRVLGLPGNPVSAMVCAELFAGPIVAALKGAASPIAFTRARLVSPIAANGSREHYLRATIGEDAAGCAVAEAAADQDSSLLSVLASAGGLIRRLPGAAGAEAGEIVEVLRFGRAP